MAVQMARLNGSCDFFTTLGDDKLGHRAVEELAARGVTVHVEWSDAPTRRALTHIDRNGERTITTIGPKLRPSTLLPVDDVDTLFFVAGEVETLRSCRAARFLGATTREMPTLTAAGVHLDLLVGSGNDPGEAYEGGLDAATVVMSDGSRGGTARRSPSGRSAPMRPSSNRPTRHATSSRGGPRRRPGRPSRRRRPARARRASAAPS